MLKILDLFMIIRELSCRYYYIKQIKRLDYHRSFISIKYD